MDVYGRGGLTLDTHDDDTGVGAAIVISQLPEGVTSSATTDVLRAHGGVRTRGAVSLGAEIGVDVPLDKQDEIEPDALLVASGSVSIAQGNVGVSGGLTMVRTIGAEDFEGDSTDDSFVNFNAALDVLVAPKVRLFGAFGINLDELDDILLVSLGAGLRVGI